MMRRITASLAVLALALSAWGCSRIVFYRYQSASCKQRGNAYKQRTEQLERDAQEKLTIGTKRGDVIRFFQDHGLPISFIKSQSEYEGTIHVKGCAPAGCGSDDALLGLRVKVDDGGSVIGKPIVGALYTNCL